MPSLPLPKRETVKFTREGLYIRLKDVYIPTRDGSELCADVFLPLSTEQGVTVPVLLSMCPYGKDVHALEWGLPQTDMYAKMNSKIKPLGPDAALEALDPFVWVRTSWSLSPGVNYGCLPLTNSDQGIWICCSAN